MDHAIINCMRKEYNLMIGDSTAEKSKKELKELTLDEWKKFNPKFTSDVLSIFELKNSVNSKKSFGGTSFSNIKKMIVKYKKNLW